MVKNKIILTDILGDSQLAEIIYFLHLENNVFILRHLCITKVPNHYVVFFFLTDFFLPQFIVQPYTS